MNSSKYCKVEYFRMSFYESKYKIKRKDYQHEMDDSI